MDLIMRLLDSGDIPNVRHRQAHFKTYGIEMDIPLYQYFKKKEDLGEATDSEELTSDTSEAQEMYSIELEEGLVINILYKLEYRFLPETDDDDVTKKMVIYGSVENKLHHLEEEVSIQILDLIKECLCIPRYLHEIWPADTPVKN